MCVSFPGEATIEIVNEKGKKKAWSFDQVKRAAFFRILPHGQSSVRAAKL